MAMSNKQNKELLDKLCKELNMSADEVMHTLKTIYNTMNPEFMKTQEATLKDLRVKDVSFSEYSLDEFILFITKFIIDQHVEFNKMSEMAKNFISDASSSLDDLNQNIDEFLAKAFEAAGANTTARQKDDKTKKNKKDDKDKSDSDKSKKIVN